VNVRFIAIRRCFDAPPVNPAQEGT